MRHIQRLYVFVTDVKAAPVIALHTATPHWHWHYGDISKKPLGKTKLKKSHST
jgi:hypothetical protein